MQFQMKMPDLATTDSAIRIVRWMIEPGQHIARGEPLLEVETDKATMEVESVASGVLCEVRCEVGASVAVGDVIAVLEVAGETRPAAAPASGPVGMFARNRAAAGVTQAAVVGIPLSLAQRTAAQRLQTSKQTIPHFYLQTSFNAAAIIARRQAAEERHLVWDAFFVLAVAKAISRADRFRCRLDGERLVPAGTDAIGVAVDSDEELFVIPVPSPAGKTVAEISDEIRRGVECLRGGDQGIRRTQPALITVTNLGMCNVERFVPIINPPEAAILGVGKVLLTPVAQANGELGVQHRGTLTLSVDHRIASGKYAAAFLEAIVTELEAM
ncbi:MAG: 2-oxo acid dehydrogenase subunit E2 [Pirellulaceae bacterium]|nr:2-oxo acid dehydrogenase subunit E2 [Pirellulaceae bacterium]